MPRPPSKRALDAMSLDQLIEGLWATRDLHPFIRALERRDPAEVATRGLEMLADAAHVHHAACLFQASGGITSPARDAARPVLMRLLRRRRARQAAIMCLGDLGLFTHLRGHRRYLEKRYPAPVRWATVLAIDSSLSAWFEVGVADRRSIDSLIQVARLLGEDATDWMAMFWLVSSFEAHGTPRIGRFLDEVRTGPDCRMKARLAEIERTG